MSYHLRSQEVSLIKLPSRQIHLDFHTSEHIPDVGRDFAAAQFQAALQDGHVNSITVFAKCHHSWSYYPTQIGKPHPTLKRNLLGEQIAACHAIGVRAPIYYTVGWSANDAEWHPEWTARNKDGSIQTCSYDLAATPSEPKPGFSWKFLCPTGGYAEHIYAQTREICAAFPVDGFFYDICHNSPCYCANCRAGMQAAGLAPEIEADAARFNILRWQRFMSECNEIITADHSEATIFYNGGGGNQYQPQWHDWQTHHELEDLPTTWGGYDKFPIRAKYFANFGKDYLAVSGKFHTSWGEFGGFKHPEAMKFEAACMVAYGARCSFGDQLHPLGQMDPATYANIGEAYAYVEQLEPYGLDGEPAANLGLWQSGSIPDDQGVANMLLESQMDFEIVTPASDFNRYRTIILPGAQCLTAESAAGLQSYVESGGSLLILGESGLDAERSRFLLEVGARYIGPGNYQLDYTEVRDVLAAGMVSSPFLNYSAALRAELNGGEALAKIYEPYFDRTYAHYCSHQNTPNRAEPAVHPGAWRHGTIVYLPHRLGAQYYEKGARLHRQLFVNALKLIYDHPMVATALPSAGRVTLTHQPQHLRYVAHLMYGPPLQRGACLVIEDLPTLTQVPLTLNVPQQIIRAYLAPSTETLPLQQTTAGTRVIVPSFNGHQAVAFEYGAIKVFCG